jgi:hypothetical protein
MLLCQKTLLVKIQRDYSREDQSSALVPESKALVVLGKVANIFD